MSSNNKPIHNKVPVYNDALEILFEGRNKAYGAYLLRRTYDKRLSRALLIGILVAALFFGLPLLYANLTSDGKDKADLLELNQVELPKPKEIEKPKPVVPPPPPKKVEPPKVETKKFVPPKIKKDEEVKKEEEIIEQKDLKDVQVADKTQEGIKSEANIPVDPGLGDEGKKEVIVQEKIVEPEIFTVVEQMPTFPGGDAEMIKYLAKNIKYPAIARDNGIEGTVVLEFIVDENGKISEIKERKGLGGGCTQEAIRVVNTMPEWKPGKQNGRPVKVRFNLPIRFRLEG